MEYANEENKIRSKTRFLKWFGCNVIAYVQCNFPSKEPKSPSSFFSSFIYKRGSTYSNHQGSGNHPVILGSRM